MSPMAFVGRGRELAAPFQPWTQILAGLVLAGAATLRSGRWPGPGRYAPLVCGVLVFVVMLPVQVARPSIFIWAIAAWNVAFIWFGWSLRQTARSPQTTPARQPAEVR